MMLDGWLALSSVYILHEQKYFLIEFSICGTAIKLFFCLLSKVTKITNSTKIEWKTDRESEKILLMLWDLPSSSLLRNSCGIHDLSLICHERQVKEKEFQWHWFMILHETLKESLRQALLYLFFHGVNILAFKKGKTPIVCFMLFW